MIQYADFMVLLPYVFMAAGAVVGMLVIAFYRHHGLIAYITLLSLAAAFALVFLLFFMPNMHRQITPLITIDRYALFFTGLIIFATTMVAVLSYSYLGIRDGHHEEFYVLLLIAALGAGMLAASTHFVSLFLGIETLTVSLYGLAAYLRSSDKSLEAGVKYLILAAVSSSFLLFGMALVYAETGSMEFAPIAARAGDVHAVPFIAGLGLFIVGIGFKLAVVPFHLWTPDVYEGAPAPVTAFIATVSKGAVFAVVLRYFGKVDIHADNTLFLVFAIIAVASMFAGNLLALLQENVKRILAYSSIAHLGYLLVSFLAGGPMAITASLFYLTAYFITTLGAFGVISMLSQKDRDADRMDDVRGLALRRPWFAGIFSAMLFSLAGIPLTAGFVGKFYVLAAGAGSALWLLVIILIINSVIGLFYYLRIVVAMYSAPGRVIPVPPDVSFASGGVLAVLTLSLIWLGVYPGPVIDIINKVIPF